MEYPVYGVGRYPVRKTQPPPLRQVVVLAEFLYRLIALGTAGNREYRQYHYVCQKVLASPFDPGSCNRAAVSYKLAVTDECWLWHNNDFFTMYYKLIYK